MLYPDNLRLTVAERTQLIANTHHRDTDIIVIRRFQFTLDGLIAYDRELASGLIVKLGFQNTLS